MNSTPGRTNAWAPPGGVDTLLRASLLALLLLGAGCAVTPPSAPASTSPVPRDVASIPEAVPRAEPRSARGNPPFYDVLGKRYFVLASNEGYVERGVASWYGPGFHEGTTSNGERYDMYAMTAAHRTLPLPSYVRVTNLRNGRSVVVRVNDRGPFKDDRIIDLSYSAAQKLEMVQDGTTFVEVRSLSVPDAATAPPAPSAGSDPNVAADTLFVQAGAFSSEDNATRLMQQLRAQGLSQSFVRQDQLEGKTLYRVRVGPIPSVREFDRVVGQLKSLGVADARLAAD